MKIRRRRFLQGALAAGGATGRLSRAWAEPEKEWLAADHLQILTAAAERVLPGAAEAGFADFCRYWLTRDPFRRAADWRPLLVAGAAQLEQRARKNFGRGFCELSPVEQDRLIEEFQQGKASSGKFRSDLFFQRLLMLALESFFGDPAYGGNRNGVGWKFAGYHHCWWAPRR